MRYQDAQKVGYAMQFLKYQPRWASRISRFMMKIPAFGLEAEGEYNPIAGAVTELVTSMQSGSNR